MNTVTLTYSINIKSSPKVIFEYISDWEKQSKWILFTSVEKTSNTPNQQGTKLIASTKLGLIKLIDPMVVTEWKPDEKIVIEHVGRVVLGKGVFKINRISNNNCEFIWEEVTPVPFGIFGRAGLVLCKPLLALMFNASLKRLKRNIELQSTTPH